MIPSNNSETTLLNEGINLIGDNSFMLLDEEYYELAQQLNSDKYYSEIFDEPVPINHNLADYIEECNDVFHPSFCFSQEWSLTDDTTEQERRKDTASADRTIFCTAKCTTCKNCVCRKNGLPCTDKCKCADTCCNLVKPTFEHEWTLNAVFPNVNVEPPTNSGPRNLPKHLSLPESTSIIWNDKILQHIYERTNWKKEYCIEYEQALNDHKEWSNTKSKHEKKQKRFKRKYEHDNENMVQEINDANPPPLINDILESEPKVEPFAKYLEKKKGCTIPNHYSKDDIKGFLQICQIMGLSPIPNYYDYWSIDGENHAFYACKLIQRIMSRKRFIDIHMHLSSEPNFLEDNVNSNSRHYWLCVKEVSVDEIIAAFKGKVRFKQYIPLKPHKYGLKYYALSDSTGYIYAFWLYQGKESRYSHNATSIVLDLVKHVSPENHVLGIDNYYGSLDLARELVNHGWKFVMTVRNNRPSYLFSEGLQKKLPGSKTRKWIHAVNKENTLVALSINDNKRVNFLTNLGSSQLIKNKPYVQEMYNKSMGCVDKSGIFLHCTHPPFRNKNWKTVHLLQMMKTSFVNQYIIFKHHINNPGLTLCDYLKHSLAQTVTFRNPYFTRTTHFPMKLKKLERYQLCSHCKDSFSRCGYKCMGCGCYLHLHCFTAYHDPKFIYY
ncbi:hypothetical protein C9374_009882 [Naegleria lovaniensis]|uniref:PiggyBac transposable element-derived protein domain-containing protein n=1 Tax=Naegleria lovaniensis TaxID=51637 RepID=A0AA88KGF7_NAELO|nr:uncharacterized protein C9374_009882 [Naegleria lovaniensis]KAG2375259.1 hypothetical protein C9374_009882 [Naegleria lovaniensis]